MSINKNNSQYRREWTISKLLEEQVYIEGEFYEKMDFSCHPLQKGEYENCHFSNCTFVNADLSHIIFMECELKACNMSMSNIYQTGFKDVLFVECKVVGLQFDKCADFMLEVRFDHCDLTLSSFRKLPLTRTLFKNSKLHEVDFSDANLSNALFENCDLMGAQFAKSNLERADFRSSYNFIINPENNRIKKARFSLAGLAALLNKYDIEIG